RLGGKKAVERRALHELHREEVLPLVDAALVDRRDTRVRERGGKLRLAEEPLEILMRLDAADELEGDDAAEVALPRLQHDAHATRAELAEQDVLAEAGGPSGRRP